MSGKTSKAAIRESDAFKLLEDSPPLRILEAQNKNGNNVHYKANDDVDLEGEDWLGQRECQQLASEISLPPIFLSPETKGFKLSKYLNSLIGLTPLREHNLPWYAPVCIQNSRRVARDLGLYPPETDLKAELLKFVDNHNRPEAEIGQRIVTAIKKEIRPSWLLHVLAALFWRIRGYGSHALDCLKIALAASPQRIRDVSLVSKAAVLYQMGRPAQAFHAAAEALSLNSSEPTANFIMGVILESKKNFTGAVYHLQQVLMQGSNCYLSSAASKFIHHAACKFKLRSQMAFDSSSDEIDEDKPICSW